MKTLASRLPRPALPSGGMSILGDRVLWALLAGMLLLGLLDPDQLGPSLAFMRKALVGMAPFFAIAVAFAAYAKASGFDQTLARVFSGKPWVTILAAAATGALSPFCSCGVIPVMAAMLRAGVPLAPVMAFCIASPVMDPEMFIITAAGISPEFAVVKTFTAFGIGLLAGFTIYGLQRGGMLQQALRPSLEAVGCCSGGAKAPSASVNWRFWQEDHRRATFSREIASTGWFLGKWLTVAFFLESLMVAYIPSEWVVRLVGGESWSAIPLAALVGIPAYMNGFAAVPLVGGLMQMGMSPGAGLAFMTAGAVSSIPAALAVYALVRRPVFALYIAMGFVGSVAAGVAYTLFL
ncbi:MAG: permease [Desulfobacterales bacterium]|nr:permease [Desulfobacterales bacterium]